MLPEPVELEECCHDEDTPWQLAGSVVKAHDVGRRCCRMPVTVPPERPPVMNRTSLLAVLVVGTLFGPVLNPSLVQAQAMAGQAAGPVPAVQAERPAPLVTLPEAAVFGVVLATAFLADEALRGEFGSPDYRPFFYQASDALGNAAIILPILGGGYLLSRHRGNDEASHALANAVFAGLLAGTATQVLKQVVGRVRPSDTEDSGEYHPFEGHAAFPSGHVSYASAVLSSLVMDSSSRALRYVAYGGVAAAALARLHYNRHWTSDVVAGAAVGIVSARLVARLRYRDTRVDLTPAGAVFRVLF